MSDNNCQTPSKCEFVSPLALPQLDVYSPDPGKSDPPPDSEDPVHEPEELPNFPVDEWLAQAPFMVLLTSELATTDYEGYVTESDEETELCTMGWAAASSWYMDSQW